MTDETRQSPAETASHMRTEIARLKVEIASRNLRITGLEHTLRPFAHIALARDDDASAADMISGPDLAITPAEVRAARKLLNLEQLTKSQRPEATQLPLTKEQAEDPKRAT
jgi:hypothetical protein